MSPEPATDGILLRRGLGLEFVTLAGYIAVQIGVTLGTGTRPARSNTGIVWLALAVVVMVALAAGKRHTGARLGNGVRRTGARVTLIDGALPGAVLAGLVLNAAVGWWWADPLSGLVILVYGVREARKTWTQAA